MLLVPIQYKCSRQKPTSIEAMSPLAREEARPQREHDNQTDCCFVIMIEEEGENKNNK